MNTLHNIKGRKKGIKRGRVRTSSDPMSSFDSCAIQKSTYKKKEKKLERNTL